MKQQNLFEEDGRSSGSQVLGSSGARVLGSELPPDQAARDFAIAPQNDVVLEASAGTGKTRVLVDRYVRLIEEGVDPRHILAITFTRKAAAEMRERVLAALRRRAAQGGLNPARWRELQQRISEIQISTIDAFCFSLLREFPLEAGVEPGFDIADETEMGRFAREAMDRALRVTRSLLPQDEALRLLFARVRGNVLRSAVEEMLDRRHVALPAVATFVKRSSAASAPEIVDAFLGRLRQMLAGSPHRQALLDCGPIEASEFRWLHADLTSLDELSSGTMARVQQLRRRLERCFLTGKGTPRLKTNFKVALFKTKLAKDQHEKALIALAPDIKELLESLETAVNALLARGLLRLLTIAAGLYESLLEEHALLDFAGMLDKSVDLLSRQEEFARSRLKLQARYHHVLVDEFQDTSRQQWRLIELLVDAWGEGEGVTDAPTSIFVVGDRKQSIYRFRHAEVTLLDEAARKISALRPGRTVRQAITASFRAVPELLAFVNALADSMQSAADLPEKFTYTERDRFPAPAIGPGALRGGEPVLGIVAESTMAQCASAVATEIERLVGQALVRDRHGPPRPARPDDIAILFRVRAGHQLFEAALESRNIRTYVYKGLGFFDAPEVQDLQALLRVLAQPDSDLRAAEFLRSRFVRLSDVGLTTLAPGFSEALLGPATPVLDSLGPADRRLIDAARTDLAKWLQLADRLPPSEVVDTVLSDSAYAFEMRGRRLEQSRENVKKVRSLIRRVESRGYATIGRIAEYFETLRAGDESHAILEASGCVNLMTMHAAKGLEFPIVFLVNLQAPGRGRGGGFSIIERGPNGEAEVAFTSNDATKLEDERDAEELRRLMYVGVTRARDRLYLSAQLDGRGELRRSGRSLANLLPSSIGALFHDAAADPTRTGVVWTVPGSTFTFAVCRPSKAQTTDVISIGQGAASVDTAPLAAGGRRPVPAAGLGIPPASDIESNPGRPVSRPISQISAQRVTGTIVHRLFQYGIGAQSERTVVRSWLSAVIPLEDRSDVADWNAVCDSAFERYRRLLDQSELTSLLEAGTCLFEVPFSLTDTERQDEVVRGVIDCLVVPETGSITVVEFKTAGRAPGHARQAEQYQAAIRVILGKKDVDVKILYA